MFAAESTHHTILAANDEHQRKSLMASAPGGRHNQRDDQAVIGRRSLESAGGAEAIPRHASRQDYVRKQAKQIPMSLQLFQ